MMKLLLLFCFCALSVAAPNRLARLDRARDRVPGRYIVKVKDSVNLDSFQELLSSHARAASIKPRISHKYDGVFHGFAVALPNRFFDFATFLRGLDGVEYVEEDGIVRSSPEKVNTQPPNIKEMVTWNLDRMDELELPLDGLYDVRPTAGYDVTVYILSGGVHYSHVEFGGRASFHWDFQCANGGVDNQGEGTALASIVGGNLYGIAGGVSIKSVRVMDDFGNTLWSNVIAGINAVAVATGPRVGLVAMIGGPSSAVDQAVADALLFGAPMVVPAGDDNADACSYSPAREPSAATVSAINDEDTKSSLANSGSCLDYFCPGDGVPTAWHTSDAATNTVTGTKYAAAHAAGAVALFLEEGLTPVEALKLPTAPGVKRKGFGSPDAIGLVNNKCC